jgi:hypothetical protein
MTLATIMNVFLIVAPPHSIIDRYLCRPFYACNENDQATILARSGSNLTQRLMLIENPANGLNK